MPTHDYIIANGTGAAVRADINSALSAIVSLNSSASEPATMYAYQLWADTGSNPSLLKIRNGANSAWVTLRQLDGDFSIVAVEDGLQATPSLTFTNDLNTGIFRPGNDSLAIVTGATRAITITSTQAVGIQTANPSSALHVAGNARVGADDVTDAHLQIGKGATGNRNSYIDIVADTTYTDYGLRIIRNNTGANATSELKHRGTGALNITTQEAAPIVFNTTNSPRLTIDSSGTILVNTAIQATSNGGLNIETTGAGTFTNPLALLNRGTTNNTGVSLSFRGLSAASAETDYAYLRMLATDTTSRHGRIEFWTANSGTVTEKLCITRDGLVGIGTSSPSSKLEIGGATNGSALTFSCTSSSPATERLLASVDYKTGNIGSTTMFAAYSVAGFADNASTLRFYTDTGTGTQQERLRITGAGNVGIGTTSPVALLQPNGTVSITGGSGASSANGLHLYFDTATNSGNISAFHSGVDNRNLVLDGKTIGFTIAGSDKARIDASGRLLVGTSTAATTDNNANSPNIQLEGASGDASRMLIRCNGGTTAGNSGFLYIARSRGTTANSKDVVAANDSLGGIIFEGTDGTHDRRAASILAEVDGTPGANDMPGRLVFSTTPSGSASPSPRMTIKSTGTVLIGKTVEDGGATVGTELRSAGNFIASRDSDWILLLDRKTNDGDIVLFNQAGTTEGSISVSGTTVSYNGAHLSRWSQLPSGQERTEILRGSVLSNLDEMCEWGEEDNEQLNRMKVSVVEGDKNVSGVFQCWDDDDDTYINDFYCAMTGDFIIRIAEGVTVERGDLLMSAGDGTAKPQDDDIIRSKTIAKVTSTNVSCTYEDGSYCVPCVLMAC